MYSLVDLTFFLAECGEGMSSMLKMVTQKTLFLSLLTLELHSFRFFSLSSFTMILFVS